MDIRIGQGLDVHAFAEGRKLILGGVEIPSPRGLIGHSDADVLVHSLMDALLGAIGLEDIGELFPNTDSKFKDANSMDLLEQVMTEVSRRSWEVVNADVSLLMEAPKISPYRNSMRQGLSKALGIGVEQFTIKATTMERLGFIGREEGIVASTVVLLRRA